MATKPKGRRRPGTKRRAPLFATILRHCFEPKDAVTIANITGIGRNSAMRVMRKLYQLRIVHIGGWTEPAFGRPPAVLWKTGEGVDAPRPLGKFRGIAYRPRQQEEHVGPVATPDMIAFANAIRAMQAEPVSAAHLVEVTGWAHTTVARFVRHCRRIGLIHVGEWTRAHNFGVWARMFKFGRGTDVAKPRPQPRALIERRSFEARKQRAHDMRMAHALAANANVFTNAA